MIQMDVNLLIYAYDPRSAYHDRARDWLEAAFREQPRIGLAWSTVLAFLRITTNPRSARPASLADAVRIVNDWLSLDAVILLHPGERHWSILSGLLISAQARGPLVPDAHLAALAIEHGAVLCTNDRDFTRFPGLRVQYPLEG
jgi:toxin-antitoxin system PIN domain toxin